MRVYDIEQNSLDWLFMRCGKPTASNFAKILTPKTRKKSASSGDYLNAILAELIVGHPIAGPDTSAMIHGREKEDEAVKAYEFMNDCETERAGFVTTDDELIGASPDRFIGKDKILEIKCPAAAHVHVDYLRNRTLEESYQCQIQGLLWICEREQLDVVSYYAEMPSVIISTKRDEVFIAALRGAVYEFAADLHKAIEECIANGWIKPNWRELMKPVPAVEEDYSKDFISDDDLQAILAANARRDAN